MKFLIGFFFKTLSFFIYLLPWPVQEALGNFLGFLWFDVLRIRRKVAIANVGLAYPELPPSERERIARSSLHHMGRTLVEYTTFPFFRRKHVDKLFDIQGMEHVQNSLRAGKGVIFLTQHMGNGDYAAAALSRLGLPLHLISKEFKSQWLNDLWFGMRKKHGTRFISPEKSSFEILRALKRNEIVIFVLDQFMGPPIGVRTKFFGVETGTAAGCALIAARTHVPVIPCYTYRTHNGQQKIHFDAPVEYSGNYIEEKNVGAMTQEYTNRIESMVRLHPEQWMWIHRRWKEFRD